ncbi:16S rRNA (cytidine1402-2'-O)-methyltransferase [Williamwhitmania taraxaci]|uniref:16S rRNA (Cytidine1402-2'-O)-methyltransferase n=2 Tax=Williamwhitmania taraxaci TaxID=1640674 RepID=A0A1G6IIQ4_9BACT|nr:16S rRNA (cytidine1402-2'-O)-methyltransferase [Williamwhitmania taraxaci]
MIPTTLGEGNPADVLPIHTIEIAQSLTCFVVEDLRSARRFLSSIKVKNPIDSLTFFELNEHTHHSIIYPMLKPAQQGVDIGLLSEAGAPAVADPGAPLVRMAHENNIRVVPLTGPSSILLSLMASGLNGQNFAFQGYLPIKPPERQRKLRDLEALSAREKQTQVFIEAPYRNMQLLNDILSTCRNNTLLCIAVDITLETEYICTKTVKEWKHALPELHKRPAIFLLMME